MHLSAAGESMKVLLVCGGMQKILADNLNRSCVVLNEQPLTAEEALVLMEEAHLTPDVVLVTDSGIPADSASRRKILENLCRLARHKSFRIVIITNLLSIESELTPDPGMPPVWQIERYETVRPPRQFIEEALARAEESRGNPRFESPRRKTERIQNPVSAEEAAASPSIWSRMFGRQRRKDDMQTTDSLTRRLEQISRSIHKVIAITGHRGAGITSTAVNLAWEANRRGFPAILIDLDIDYRSLNLYFSTFHEQARQDEDLQASLFRLLARPSDYETAAWHLKGELWLSSLGYGYDDPRQIEQLFTASRLTGLLSVLRTRFQMVILDMPMELLGRFREAFHQIDAFGLCVPNNLHGVVSLARSAELVLEPDSARHMNAKSKLIVTRYNELSHFRGEIFTPEKVREVLTSGLSTCFPYEMSVAGVVPYSSEFDSQIERDLPITSVRKEFETAYGQILLRLMESA